MDTDSDPDLFSRGVFPNRIGEDQTRLELLRKAVLAGEESGIADGDVMKEIRERTHNRASTTGRG
jgi:hypothetical protein